MGAVYLTFFQKIRLLMWKNFCRVLNNRVHFLMALFVSLICLLYVIIINIKFDGRILGIQEHSRYTLNQEISVLKKLLRRIEERQRTVREAKPSFQHSVFIPQLVLAFSSEDSQTFDSFSLFIAENLQQLVETIHFEDCESLRKAMMLEHYFAGICLKEDLPHLDYDIIFPSEYREIVQENILSHGWKTYRIGLKQAEFDPMIKRASSFEGVSGIGFLLNTFFSTKEPYHLPIQDLINLCALPLVSTTVSADEAYRSIIKSTVILHMSPALFVIYLIVREKETAIRTYLKLKRFGVVVQNIAWTLTLFLIQLIPCIMFLLILKIRWNHETALFSNSSLFLILVGYSFYLLSHSMFFVMLSAFCCNTLSVAPIVILTFLAESFVPNSLKFFFSWMNYIYHAERYLGGLNWKMTPTILMYVSFFIINFVLFFVLSLITDGVNPGQYGTRFPYLRKLWTGRVKKRKDFYFDNEGARYSKYHMSTILERNYHDSGFEMDNKYFSVSRLCKKVGKKNILDGITFTLFANEIVCLVGTNGSGKTLLCKILGGLVEPTSGYISIAGYNLLTDTQDALENVGFACGNLLLFDDLTVAQQILFFVKASGIRGFMLKIANFREICDDFKITHHNNCLIKNLSLANQNLLAIACAFSSGTKCVILDSVDLHLDTEATDVLIRGIQKWRQSLSILLSTQSCTLAEVVADRFLMLGQGGIVCSGSMSFIRDTMDDSYYLTLSKGKKFRQDNYEKIRDLVQKYFEHLHPSDPLEGNNIFYKFPLDEEEQISNLLEEIEQKRYYFNLKNITFQRTTLHDVLRYINVPEIYTGSAENVNVAITNYLESRTESVNYFDYQLVSGKVAFHQKTIAMIKMNFWINYKWPFQVAYYFALATMILIGSMKLFILVGYVAVNKAVLLHPSSYSTIRLLAAVQHEHKLFKPNHLIANTYWYYRELSYLQGFELIVVEGNDLGDYIYSEVQLLDTKFYFGGIEKYYSHNNPLAKHPILLTSYFNNQILLCDISHFNFAFESLLKASFGNEFQARMRFCPLPFERGIDETMIMSLNKLCYLLALFITFATQFPFFRFFGDDHESRNMKTEMMNSTKGLEYWLSTFICLLPVIGACTLICLLSLVFNPQVMQIPQALISICIAVPLCVIYSRYYRVLIDRCVNDVQKANAIAFSLFVFSYFNQSFYKRSSFFDIRLKLYQFFLPYQFVLSMFFTILLKAGHQAYCSYEHIYEVSIHIRKCSGFPNCCEEFLNWTSSAFDFLYMSLVILFIILAIVFVENIHNIGQFFQSKFFHRRRFRRFKKESGTSFETLDSLNRNADVNVLRKNVIVMDYVQKTIKKRTIIANATMKIQRGEIFLISGNNGSGKTMLMNIIAGKTSFTGGWMKKIGDTSKSSRKKPSISFCPQVVKFPFKCLVGQYIESYALQIRIPANVVSTLCIGLAKKLNIYTEYYKELKYCSNGNQRRIGILLALLGHPKIILVDSCLVSIDSLGVQAVCYILRRYTKHGGTVVVASADSPYRYDFCDRWGYINEGSFEFVGHMPGLKNLKTPGYLLKVKLKREIYYKNKVLFNARKDMKNLFKYRVFVETNFEGAVERKERFPYIFYFIPNEKVSLRFIFNKISTNFKYLNIDEFMISTNIEVSIQDRLLAMRNRQNFFHDHDPYSKL